MSEWLSRFVLPVVVISLAAGVTACAEKSTSKPVAQAPPAQPAPARTQVPTTPATPPAASVPDRPGIVYAERARAQVTVTAVDQSKRTVTLRRADGSSLTLKVPPAARNFDQIRPGDTVTAEYLDSVAVFVRKATAPPEATETAAVGVAPKGGMPGAVMVDTVQMTARVESVDLSARTLVLQAPDGFRRLVQVDPSVKRLDEVRPGDEVVVRHTEAIVLLIDR